MASDDPFTLDCDNCGNEYDPENEVAEDHDEDCPIHDVLVRRGQTEGDR